MAMIKEKLKGHKPIIAADPQRGNVVNLMDALKQSLGAGEAAGAEQEQGAGGGAAPAEKPAAKAARRRPAGRRPRPSRDARSPARSVGLVGGAGAACRGGSRRARSRARGGELHRGVDARHDRWWCSGGGCSPRRATAAIEARVAAARGAGAGAAQRERLPAAARPAARRRARRLGAAGARRAVAGSAQRDFELLALFDGFEHDVEPFSFRDLILARKYAGLIAGGAGWGAIVRSVHRFGPAVSLTAKSLQVGGGRRSTPRDGEGLSELDGQLLLGLGARPRTPTSSSPRPRRRRRTGGMRGGGGALRALPRDRPGRRGGGVQPRELPARGRAGRGRGGAGLARALKLDPGFVEAWFNLAGLVADARPRRGGARGICERAIALDPGLCRRGLQPRDARVRGGRARRGAALVGALPRARRRLASGRARRSGGCAIVALQARGDAAG